MSSIPERKRKISGLFIIIALLAISLLASTLLVNNAGAQTVPEAQMFQIVHDTQTEFAAGTFNQTVLEGTETAPEIGLNDLYDIGTYTSEILDLNAASFGTLSWTVPTTSPYPWGEWTKYEGNPVITDPSGKALVENILTNVDSGEPILYDGKYWLVYSPLDDLRLAYSTDPNLLMWTLYELNPILSQGEGEYSLSAPNIFKDGDTYYLFYDVALDSPHGSAQRLAYATASTPLGPWTKGPVILDIGDPGEYDDGRVSEPFVLRDGDTYYLFYMGDHYPYGDFEQIALATTTAADFPLGPGGGNWTKHGLILPHNPDPSAWDSGLTADPSVIKVNETFYMLYTGSYANVAWKLGIAYADSPFGAWTRPDSPNLVQGPPGSWDDDKLVRGAIHYHNGKYVMPYTGISATPTRQGGIATADPFVAEEFETRTSPDGSTWEEWRPVLNDTTIQSSPDRYFQYRAPLHNGSSPTLTSVTINYQIGEGANMPPVASNLTITPSSPYTTDDLVGSYTYSDADSDDENGTEIRWFKNGVLQPEYNDTLTVLYSSTEPGQMWAFTARPKDGIEFGDLRPSPSVTIRDPLTYIFSDGIESGSFSVWNGIAKSGAGSDINTESNNPHHGTYNAYAYTRSEAGQAYCYKTFSGQTTAYARAYFKFSWIPDSSTDDTGLMWLGAGTTWLSYVKIGHSGTNPQWTLLCRDGAGYRIAYSVTPTLATNTWFCVEIKSVVHGSAGEARLYVDGIERIVITGKDTDNYGNLTCLRIGETYASGGDAHTNYFDCVVVAYEYIGPETEVDIRPPVYSDVGTNATVADQPCLFYTRWTDDSGLSGYIFSTNNTGTWLNDTWTPLSGLSDWSNVTKRLNPTVGVRVQYRFYCNDTSNNWRSTPIQTLIVTEPEIWYDSVLSVSVSSSPALVGYKVNIMGSLSYQHNSSGILNAPVRFYYSVTGGENWNVITSTTTASNGSYYVTWYTMYTGSYIIKAVYIGDEDFNVIGDEATVNLIITDIEEQVFCVSSNSTVSILAFNSTAREITFTLSGPDNTTGYLNIFLSKELVPDINDLKIYFDGLPKSYEAVSVDDVWFIHLSYDHSTHTLRVCLSSALPTYAFSEPVTTLSVGVIAIVAVVLLSVTVFLVKRRRAHAQAHKPKSVF